MKNDFILLLSSKQFNLSVNNVKYSLLIEVVPKLRYIVSWQIAKIIADFRFNKLNPKDKINFRIGLFQMVSVWSEQLFENSNFKKMSTLLTYGVLFINFDKFGVL